MCGIHLSLQQESGKLRPDVLRAWVLIATRDPRNMLISPSVLPISINIACPQARSYLLHFWPKMGSLDEINVAEQPSKRNSLSQKWMSQLEQTHHVDGHVIEAENEDKMTPYLAFLILTAALGGFPYGYDTGVVGVALPYTGTELSGKVLTYAQQEIATAATTIGSIFGAATLGLFADKWGRKMCLLISDLFFTAGAIIITSSFSLGQLIPGRLVLGCRSWWWCHILPTLHHRVGSDEGSWPMCSDKPLLHSHRADCQCGYWGWDAASSS